MNENTGTLTFNRNLMNRLDELSKQLFRVEFIDINDERRAYIDNLPGCLGYVQPTDIIISVKETQ